LPEVMFISEESIFFMIEGIAGSIQVCND